MDSRCGSDFECPFNFHCDASDRCIVSSCELSDDQDLFSNEGMDCFFDEDCTFYAPHDNSSWGCIQKSCNQSSCRYCKRCPSEPRIAFNASENFWSHHNESLAPNHTETVSPIPPLHVLLNSSFYILGPDDFPVRRPAEDDVTFSNATADPLSTAGNETTGTEREEDFMITTPMLIYSNESITSAVAVSTTPNSDDVITTTTESRNSSSSAGERSATTAAAFADDATTT